MNFLFTFTDHIDSYVLTDFQLFAWELAEINIGYISANDNDEGAVFPPNFILGLPSTDDPDHLDLLSHKYHQLCAECPWIDTSQTPAHLGVNQ
jgi:hypothetical protein